MLTRKELGKRLTMLRTKSNLSQKQVADFLGVDQSMLSKMETGERAIGVTALEKLASLYCMSVGELSSEESNPGILQLAFRTNKLTDQDIIHLAEINRIIINQRYMDKIKRGVRVDE